MVIDWCYLVLYLSFFSFLVVGDEQLFIVDINQGIIVMTMSNFEKTIRSICWHPTDDFQYVTGHENGNICLWDVRNNQNYVHQFGNDKSSSITRHNPNLVVGLKFYNNGKSVISVDKKIGMNFINVKTWYVGYTC